MQNDMQSTAEPYISLNEAAGVFPLKNGKKTPFLTMKRWIVGGYRGIRLEGLKIGNTWYTTRTAIAQFQAACTAKAIGDTGPVHLSAKADAALAMDALRRRGVKMIKSTV